jgi:hypothetical protein
LDGPRVLPGRYTVRATASNESRDGTLTVLNDPRSHVSMNDLRLQLAFLLRTRNDIVKLTHAIERLQAQKAQAGSKAAEVDALLRQLYNPDTPQEEDALRAPQQLYGQFISLAADAGSADAVPTQSEYAVLDLLEARMNSLVEK